MKRFRILFVWMFALFTAPGTVFADAELVETFRELIRARLAVHREKLPRASRESVRQIAREHDYVTISDELVG